METFWDEKEAGQCDKRGEVDTEVDTEDAGVGQENRFCGFFFFFFSFLGPYPWNMEVPRPRGQIRDVTTSLRHSRNHAGSELHL